ncbi:hypothetical protein COO60DRAFT_11327 [Scenedesmus sp. NREL 46B-D3]|nr:hypothetical protein COO60DRAFT_11327 [Scenedesmus sp. NREL 46B-D3]
MVRQPQLPLPALPLPLRQQLDLDALPPPSYRVPLLVSLPSAVDDGVTATVVAAKDWVHGRVAYHLQQLATANISTKVVVLSLFATPFILLFGYMYHKAAHVKFGAAMYKVYALLYRVPGVGIAKEDNVYAYIVANMAFLAGLFTFAGILGIVSDEIKMGIKNSRSGNYNMRLSGHILILNWNGNTTSLLRQIASAYAEGGMFDNGRWLLTNRPPVVVLADKKKAQMDEAVHEMLRDRGLHLEVHTREGNPFKLSELKRVAASKAGTIIVLHPDSASSAQNAEAIKASVAMCITALGPQSNQKVVVQATGSPSEAGLLSSLSVASQLGGQAAIQSMELPDQQLMLQLVTQSAAQPGILTCWLDILALANNSAQFCVAELPAGLEGRPYVDVRRAFAHAVLCGYRLPSGDAVMNPGEADVPPAGAQLIFLGRGGERDATQQLRGTLLQAYGCSTCESGHALSTKMCAGYTSAGRDSHAHAICSSAP